MANPWEIDWDWDEPAPAEGQPSQGAGPWTMNWDWNRAEASAATKGPLRHDLESKNWKRPEGELFHAQGYIEGAHPDQATMLATEDPSWWDVVGKGFNMAGQDFGQTYGALVHGDPNVEAIPSSKLDAQLNTAEDSLELSAKKMGYLAARAVPAMTAFIAGAGLAAPGTVASVAAGTGAGTVGTMLQSYGPHLANALNKYPNDPDRAYDEAYKAAAADGVFATLGGAASMAPIFRASPVKNFLIQTFGIQPAIGAANMGAVENITGDHLDMDGLDRYLTVAGPGTIQAAAGAVMTPSAPRSPHVRQPREVHFADLIPEASRVEERVADANLWTATDSQRRWYGDEASRKAVAEQPGGPGLRKRSLTPEERNTTYAKIIAEADEALARIAPHASAEPLKSIFASSPEGDVVHQNGMALGKMIAYALDASNENPVGTVRHEGFHVVEALRRSGAFKPHEWQALEDAAAKWAENHVEFLSNYLDPSLPPAEQRRKMISETIAQEFGQGRAERWKGYPPLVRRAFYRIEGLVKQLSMTAKRLFGKAVTGEDVLTLIDTGVIGRRAKRIDAGLRPIDREIDDFRATEVVRAAVGGRNPDEIAAQRTASPERLRAVEESGRAVVRPSKNPAQSLTAFGKALAKHATGARETSTFPKVSGSNEALNRRGAEIARAIMDSHTSAEQMPRGGVRIRDDSGRGIEFDASDRFVGFLDPESASDIELKAQVTRGRIDPRFRSQLDEELLKTKLTKGTGSQWRAELTKNGKGAKLEELEDSGLHDFLTEHADKPLTLAQVREVREANRHQLEVIELTDGTGTPVDVPEPVFEPEPNMPERFAPDQDQPEGPPNPLIGLDYQGEPITPELAKAMIDDFVDGGPLDDLISEEVNRRISESDDYDTNEWPRWRYSAKQDERPVFEVEEIDGHGENIEWHDRYDDEREANRDADNSEGTYFTIKVVPVQTPQELPLLSRLTGKTAKSDEVNRYEVWRSNEDTTDDGFNGRPEGEEPVEVFDSWNEAEKYAKDETRRFRVSEGERYDEWRIWDHKEDDWSADHDDTYESERRAERDSERANDDWSNEWYEGVQEEADSDVRSDKEWISEQIADHLYGEVADADDRQALRRWVDHVRGTPSRRRPETPEYQAWNRRNSERQREFQRELNAWMQRNQRRDDTHYRTYANEGGTNYRELILTVPTMEERGRGHGGHSQHSDKMVAHARTQDFDTSEGLKAKSIEEEQSDTHQTASDKYWGKAGRDRLAEETRAAIDARYKTQTAVEQARLALLEYAQAADIPQHDPFKTLIRDYGPKQIAQGLEAWRNGVDHGSERSTGNDQKAVFRRSNYQRMFSEELDALVKNLADVTAADDAAAQVVDDLRSHRVTSYPHRKSWPMVLFKKVLLDAVLGGYDVITLATGEQNTDRYRHTLRKAVKDVSWGERADGLFDVEFTLHDKTRDGKDTHLLTGITMDRLAEYIGKDGAKQIMKDKLGERPNPNKGPMGGPVRETDYVSAGGYEGQDIKFGGVGMYNFYDKVLPGEIDKFFKKWGVKRERVKLARGDRAQWVIVFRDAGHDFQPYDYIQTKEQAEATAERLRREPGNERTEYKVEANPGAFHEVHGWRIPDDLRKAINQGTEENTPDGVIRLKDEYPIFRYQITTKGKTAPADPRVNTPEFRAWWKKSHVKDALLHPKRVYHGTQREFDKFKPGAIPESEDAFHGARFYFTSSPDDAFHNYGDPATREAGGDVEGTTGGSVMPVYLSIQNPVYWGGKDKTMWRGADMQRFGEASVKVIERRGHAAQADRLRYQKVADMLRLHHDRVSVEQFARELGQELSKTGFPWGHNEIVRATLEEMGYDGIIHHEAAADFLMPHMDADTTHYVAFRPNQIKSVFNDGSWSSRAEFMKQVVQGPKSWKGAPKYDTAAEDTLSAARSVDALTHGWQNAKGFGMKMAPEDGGILYVDDEVYLSERPEDLKQVYRDDWLTLRTGSPHFKQWALMSKSGPVGRIHGTIKGDAIEVGWLGVMGGEEGLSPGAFILLGAALREATPSSVTRITGLRKTKVGAYEKPQPKESPRKAPTQVPARPKSNVRTARPDAPPGFQRFGPQRAQPDVEDDPLLEYFQGM